MVISGRARLENVGFSRSVQTFSVSRHQPSCRVGLTVIPPKVAEALAEYKAWPSLDGLTTITPEVPKTLVKCDGDRYLSSLSTISPEVAEALAKHNGDLYPDGLA